jgi:hypothetical protein
MTSVYMPTSSINSTSYNNFHGYSNYGLNYFNDAVSDFSDEYQHSLSPVSSPDHLNAQYQVNLPYNGFYNQVTSNNFYQQSNFNKIHQAQPEDFRKFSDCKQQEEIKFPKDLLKFNRCETFEKKSIDQKSVSVAPEILKRRRVAANARERKRMNSLNYAFDR